MSFEIKPFVEPHVNENTPESALPKTRVGESPDSKSAKARAIAALLGDNAEQDQQPAAKQAAQPSSEPVEAAVQEHNEEGIASSEEAAQEETVAAKPAAKPISSEYALLARKEKQIRLESERREKQYAAREAELKAREEALNKSSSFDESKYIPKEKLEKDVFGTLLDMGLTYDQLTQAAMNGPSSKDLELLNTVKALKAEIEALKGETSSTKKSFEDLQAMSEKQGLLQYTKQVDALVNNNPEFETIKEMGKNHEVVELIKETLNKDGVLLSVEEAAQAVENHYFEEALKVSRLKKIQAKLAPQASVQKSTEQSKQPQQMKTLTNSVGSSRQLSAKERAILAAEGKLN